MKLVSISKEDEDLAVRIECDSKMMREIGGPRSEKDVRKTHQNRLKLMQAGEAHMFKIVSDDESQVFGTVGYWKADWEGPKSWEMGWFVLPEYQRRGIATEASREVLAKAQEHPDVEEVHAYPTVSNVASNIIAERIGMRNLGEFENEGFAGMLRCNHWRTKFTETSST